MGFCVSVTQNTRPIATVLIAEGWSEWNNANSKNPKVKTDFDTLLPVREKSETVLVRMEAYLLGCSTPTGHPKVARKDSAPRSLQKIRRSASPMPFH